jgi:hypothetical protein
MFTIKSNEKTNLLQNTSTNGKTPTSKFPSYSNIIFNGWIKECEDHLLRITNPKQPFLLQSTYDDGKAATWLNKNCSNLPKNLQDSDWIIKLIEDITTFFFMVSEAHSNGHFSKKRIIFACTTFAKLRSEGSLINSVIFKNLLSFYDYIFDEPHVQGFEDHFRTCRELLGKYEDFKDAVIFKKLYRVMMYAMSLSVFDKLGFTFDRCGYTHFEAEAIKKKFTAGPDLIYVLLDTLLFLCERGFQILKTGQMQYIFHSGKTYSEFYDQHVLLKRQSLLLANPEAHGFKESTFLANLDDAIEKGNCILKHTSRMAASDKRLFQNMVSELQYIRDDLYTMRAARENRRAPFSMLIFGESGIGKSTIKDIFFHQYAKIKNLDSDPSFCYTRNAAANFWDGFKTSQWALVLDDIAAIHPNKAPSGDLTLNEVIQVINNIPFCPDQASLTDKGRTPFKGEFVMATTNVKHLNADQYFSHPSAVQRRFPFIITPSVKKEYANDDGSLDSTKTLIIEDHYPDYWNWTVEKVLISKINNPYKRALTEMLLTTDNIIDVLKWFNNAVLTFDSNQDIIKNSIEAMKNITLCEKCFLPTSNCECQVQSFISEFSFNFIFWSVIIHSCQFLYFIYLNTLDDIIYHTFGRTAAYLLLRSRIAQIIGYNFAHDLIRRRCQQIGERIQRRIGHPKLLLAAITVLTSGTIVYKMLSYAFSTTTQGSISEETGTKPKAMDEEKENVWYKNSFELSTFEVSKQILSSKSLTRDQFINIINRNCIYIEVVLDNGTKSVGRMLCLKGQKYLTNNHIIPLIVKTRTLRIVQHATASGVNMNMNIIISESQIVRDVDNDICIVTIPNLPPKKDITPYLTDDNLDIKTNGFYLSRNNDGSLKINNLTCIKPNGWSTVPTQGFTGSIWSASASERTVNGDCGTLMVGETVRGFVILGIHVIISPLTRCIGAIKLNNKIIENLLVEDIYTMQASAPTLSSETAQRNVVDLHPKSTFRYIPEGSAAVYGSFSGFRPSHKSNVDVSPLVHYLSPHGYKIKYGAPVMSGWKPWNIAANDMVKPVVNIDFDILKQCEDSFFEDIISKVKNLDQLHVYDNFTAINGAAGVSYVDKLNRNTSAGNPWKKGKKHFLIPIPPQHDLQDPVDVTQEIKDNIDRIISTYHSRQRVMPNFCAHLKDEAVSFKKIAAGKTRVFTGAPMDWTIVVRKYLLSTIRLMQTNREIFESAPGIIAQSKEWHDLYEYVTTHGKDRIIAGDYKAFDKTMASNFILSAFNIIKRMCIESGNFSPNDLSVIDGIAQDVAFPLVDYNGDLVEFFGSNPSGHPLTVTINGLVNALYMRYVYYQLNPKHEVKSFKGNVSLMTYGDDNIMSVSESIDWYTHTTVSKAFAEMGITYTMADKEAESVPFVNISQASFLKRSWVYDDDVKFHLAPLEHDSIEKMLMVWVKSKSVSQEEQTISVVTTALREYFFYGKAVYNQKLLLFKNMIHDLNLDAWVNESTFLPWEQLVSEFYKNSQIKRDEYHLRESVINLTLNKE